MECSNCGTEVTEADEVCPNCGALFVSNRREVDSVEYLDQVLSYFSEDTTSAGFIIYSGLSIVALLHIYSKTFESIVAPTLLIFGFIRPVEFIMIMLWGTSILGLRLRKRWRWEIVITTIVMSGIIDLLAVLRFIRPFFSPVDIISYLAAMLLNEYYSIVQLIDVGWRIYEGGAMQSFLIFHAILCALTSYLVFKYRM